MMNEEAIIAVLAMMNLVLNSYMRLTATRRINLAQYTRNGNQWPVITDRYNLFAMRVAFQLPHAHPRAASAGDRGWEGAYMQSFTYIYVVPMLHGHRLGVDLS